MMQYSVTTTENHMDIYSTYIHVINKYTSTYTHIYIYAYIYTKIKAEIFLMMRSFLFHIQNKSFHVLFNSILHNGKFYNIHCILTSIITNSETY